MFICGRNLLFSRSCRGHCRVGRHARPVHLLRDNSTHASDKFIYLLDCARVLDWGSDGGSVRLRASHAATVSVVSVSIPSRVPSNRLPIRTHHLRPSRLARPARVLLVRSRAALLSFSAHPSLSYCRCPRLAQQPFASTPCPLPNPCFQTYQPRVNNLQNLQPS